MSVNIGTNLGDREANLRRAVDEIARSVGSTPRVSSIYESEAWGYQSDNPFFNIAVEFESDLPVGRLLDIFQRIEREAGSSSHRNADGSYADRQLDIDIVYAGDEVVDTAAVVLPHPRMDKREFVLAPLCELSPGWRHPVSLLTAAEMLARLRATDKTDRKRTLRMNISISGNVGKTDKNA